MQLSEAREIVGTPENTKNWQGLTQEEADSLMEYVQGQQDRQECCFPYDCMCHEMCYDGNECGACQRRAARWSAVEKVLEKFPMGYQYAAALTRIGEQELISHQLQTIKDLEATGDYVAANRLFYGEDADY